VGIKTRYIEGTPVLQVEEEFITAVGTNIRDEIEKLAMHHSYKWIVLNLSNATLIDGFAIENISICNRLLAGKSGGVLVVTSNPEVQNRIELDHKGGELRIFNEESAALIFAVTHKRGI
jgi:anti-anti-sigma regulatory factor